MTGSTRFSKILYDFESSLAVERNFAPGTRRGYVYDVDRFAEHLLLKRSKMPPIEAITSDDIRSYLEHMKEHHHLKSTTLSRIISSLRRFFAFCVERRYVTVSPAEAIHNPKKPKNLPIFLVADEIKRLFSIPDRAEPRGKRDFLILVMLGFTGIRLKEIVGLDIGDVDMTLKQIRVFGKGSRERIVPLNPLVIEALTDYLHHRQATADSALLLGRGGKRISPRMVEVIVEKYAKVAGIFRKGISPHKLRHTFATLLHMKDVDILEIQSLLGHASITSTQIYTHTNPGKLRAAVEKLSDI
jgi:site-specific recombinase XerD